MGLGAGASGSCIVTGRAGSKNFKIVAEEMLSLDAKCTGAHNIRTGECGDDYCASARVDVKGRAKTPSLNIPSFRWFKSIGTYQCEVGFDGCTETNSCGDCACGDGGCNSLEQAFSCTVNL